MGLAKNFVGSGFSGQQAQAITSNVIGTVAAAGTTQGTATALTADVNNVTSGGADSGVILYNGTIGDDQYVYNNQLVQIRVYPPTGAKINQIAADGGHILAAQTSGFYKKLSATQCMCLQSA